MKNKTIVHLNPIWRDKANFIIGGQFHLSKASNRISFEQLWARQIKEYQFELCCIPFFIYNLSLGDEVETDAEYNISRVIKPSGRYTFRVWFEQSKDMQERRGIVDSIQSMGCLMEWSSQDLLAVDAESHPLARNLSGYLSKKANEGLMIYETGKQ